jgi:TPR repeat protein
MKKLIQILIVCGLVVVIGGTASGDSLQSYINLEEGLDALKKKDYATAREILEPLALNESDGFSKKAMSDAQYGMGIMEKKEWFDYGDGGAADRALEWFSKAADQGNKLALTELCSSHGIVKKCSYYSKKFIEQCSFEPDSKERLTCYDNLPKGLKNQKCSSETDSLKKLSCYEKPFLSITCSSETDSLKRLTCYDNLPDNMKNQKCSSVSDSLKRLSCFESKKNSKVTEASSEGTVGGNALSPSLVFSATTLGDINEKKEKRDGFGEFEEYQYRFGCDYILNVTNNTGEKVLVQLMKLELDSNIFKSKYDTVFVQFSLDPIKPGETVRMTGGHQPMNTFESSKILYSEDTMTKKIKKFGCAAQKDKLNFRIMMIEFQKNSPLKKMDIVDLIKQTSPLHPK